MAFSCVQPESSRITDRAAGQKMSSGGKSGAGGGSKSYNYYGTIAALWHVGQMDELTGIIIDDKIAWSGSILRVASTNPVEVTIPGRGIYRHYWGLGAADQGVVDAKLQSGGNNNGHQHPAYVANCYGVFDDILFGQERTQAPTCAIRGKRAPVQSLITGVATQLNDGNANPFCILAELLTNEFFGLRLSVDKFAAASWQAAADALITRDDLCYVSPFVTSAQPVTSLAQDMFALCDGWLRAETGTGLCEAGLFAQPQDIDLGSLGLIDSKKFTAEPDLSPQTWDDVQTTWNVRFRDRDYNFKTRSLRHDDPGALQRVGDIRTQDLQRDSIVRISQAQNHAREWGRRFSVPGMSGKISVRSESIAGLRPGDNVLVDIQPEPGGAAANTPCRVIEITRTPKGLSKVKIEAVRSLAQVPYTPAVGVTPPSDYASPCASAFRFFELPLPLGEDENYKVAPLVERPGELVTSFKVLYDKEEDGDFSEVSESSGFAVKAKVFDPISSADVGPFRVELTGTLDREIFANSPGSASAENDEVLMIILKKAVDDQIAVDAANHDWLEIFSCSAFTSETGNKILVDALRERQGSFKHEFVADDEVWFIRRSNLQPIEHAELPDIADAGGDAFFELHPGSMTEVTDECGVSRFMFSPLRVKPAQYYRDLYPPLTLIPTGANIANSCKSRGGTATLIGCDEIVPSTPPNRYRKAKQTGNATSNFYTSPDCTGAIASTTVCVYNGTKTYNKVTGAVTVTGGTTCDGVLVSPGVSCPSYSGSVCGILISVGPTIWRGTATNACCPYGVGGSIKTPSYNNKVELSDKDSESDALARMEASLPDWSSTAWGPCTGAEAYWTERTTGYSVDKFDVKMRFVGSLYFSNWTYTLTILFESKPVGGSVWSDDQTIIYNVPAGPGGTFDYEIDFPNTQGYVTRVKTITFGP
jgi:hypothetical protein